MIERGKIFVTGGAGFIGSALVWALNCQGARNILIADFLERSEKWRNLAPLRFDDYVESDDLFPMLDPRRSSLGDVRTVLHLGACSSTIETMVQGLSEGLDPHSLKPLNIYGYSKYLFDLYRGDVQKLCSSGYQRPTTPLREAAHDYVVNYPQPGLRPGDELTRAAVVEGVLA